MAFPCSGKVVEDSNENNKMTFQLPKAETQYEDLTGTVSLDFHNSMNRGFKSYASTLGIETSKFPPIGLKFSFGGEDDFCLDIFCIDNQNKEEFAKMNNGKIPIVKKSIKTTFADFLKNIKGFQIVLETASDNKFKLTNL